MTKIHTPPNTRPLDQLYVFVSEDEDGRGLVAGFLPATGAQLFVTGSPKVADYMKTLAPELATMLGKRIKLYAYTRAEELAAFEP
jgi:hypothetical protein